MENSNLLPLDYKFIYCKYIDIFMTITRRESKNLRHKMRRKRRHIRQIESRMKNQYEEYIAKMNKFEYDTWLSQISDQTEHDIIYKNQVKLKEQMLKDIKAMDKEVIQKELDVNEYLIIDEVTNEDNNESSCLIC